MVPDFSLFPSWYLLSPSVRGPAQHMSDLLHEEVLGTTLEMAYDQQEYYKRTFKHLMRRRLKNSSWAKGRCGYRHTSPQKWHPLLGLEHNF